MLIGTALEWLHRNANLASKHAGLGIYLAQRKHKNRSRTRPARPRPAILPDTSRRGSPSAHSLIQRTDATGAQRQWSASSTQVAKVSSQAWTLLASPVAVATGLPPPPPPKTQGGGGGGQRGGETL